MHKRKVEEIVDSSVPSQQQQPPLGFSHNLDSIVSQRAKRSMFALPRQRAIAKSADAHALLQQRAMHEEKFALPVPDFTKRQRYRDADGNALAPALEGDALYRSLLRVGKVDALDPADRDRAANNATGLPPSRHTSIDADGTRGAYHGSVLLFVRLKPDGRVAHWPNGQMEFVDPRSDHLFTGTVVRSVFRGRAKSGYVVLRDVVAWGRLARPDEFTTK